MKIKYTPKWNKSWSFLSLVAESTMTQVKATCEKKKYLVFSKAQLLI